MWHLIAALFYAFKYETNNVKQTNSVYCTFYYWFYTFVFVLREMEFNFSDTWKNMANNLLQQNKSQQKL